MPDGSGVALFNDFSGLSAFLKANSAKLSQSFNIIKNDACFQSNDFCNWFDIDENKANKMIYWLLDNRFIEVKPQ